MSTVGCIKDRCGRQSFDTQLNGQKWDAVVNGCKFVRNSDHLIRFKATERDRSRFDARDVLTFDGIPFEKGRVYLTSDRPRVTFLVFEEFDAAIDGYKPISDSTSYIDIMSIDFSNDLIEAEFHLELFQPAAENAKYPDTIIFSDGKVQFRLQ